MTGPGPEALLARLSIHYEDVVGGPGYHYVALDMDEDGCCDQIGLEDGPGSMILDFSDEALLENAELSEEDARLLQRHADAVIRWVRDRGYRVLIDGPGGPEPAA